MAKRQSDQEQAAIEKMLSSIREAIANPTASQEVDALKKTQQSDTEDAKQPKKRLFECEDCKGRRFVSWVELNRAAKPRCMACGSTRLELVNDDAKDDRARLQQHRLAGTGGSLRLASDLDKPHKKVT